MAKSPTHKFGQIIGFVLERAVAPHLAAIAAKHGLYLDKKGARKARGKRSKITWIDANQNAHDLDYVLERGGTAESIGVPVAFIETAWRRYTKHSRNKAQEIQGAIVPLRETHQRSAPFVGVILAGVFTAGALNQLRRLDFKTLFFSADEIARAFRTVGIEAQVDEETSDEVVAERVRAWEALPESRRADVAEKLIEIEAHDFREFMDALERSITRRVASVRVLPLHGCQVEWGSVDEAVRFIQGYDANAPHAALRYEVELRYSNEDVVRGQFSDKAAAIEFLRTC